MLPLPLVLDLVKMWALQQTLKKLRQYAADPRPDVQFDMPIVGQKVDIWVRAEPTPPPTAPKAKRATGNHRRRREVLALLPVPEGEGSNHKVIASVRLVFCSSKSLSAIVCSLLA
jgi:hypothetical protein